MKRSFTISALLLLLVSCSSRTDAGKGSVRLVSDIAQSGSMYEHKLLDGYSIDPKEGNIVIVDEPSRALRLSRVFAASDRFDNITAAPVKDGLPDFAGEQIACIRDDANAPYAQYVDAENYVLLREVSLCNMIHAADTSYKVRTFTDVTSIHRSGAKAILLSSPYSAAYGCHDIAVLKQRMNIDIPVICPSAAIVQKAIEDRRENIAIICDESVASQNVYSAIFSEYVPSDKVPFTVCYTHNGAKKDVVKGLLDRYIASGTRSKIDAIILDDLAMETADEVARAIMIIRADKTAENHRYMKFLAQDIKIYSTAVEAVDASYRLMRERNLFSHKIAKPDISEYITVLSDEVNDKSRRETARGSYSIYEYVQN